MRHCGATTCEVYMKILFDIDQLPSTISTCKSKEERFAELEKRICEIDEKFAKVLARYGGDAALLGAPSDDKTSDAGKAVVGIETEKVDAKATCGSGIPVGADEKQVDASEPECSRVATPKTRTERITELECRLADVSEKFDKLAARFGVEASNAKTDDESSAIPEESTAEPISDSTVETTAEVETAETTAEPIETAVAETVADVTEKPTVEPTAVTEAVYSGDETDESK